MNLRHPSLYTALAIAVLTAQPLTRAEAGVVRLVFNNSSTSIGLNQTSGELIRYLNNSADRFLSLRLAEPLLCAEYPGSASSNVRVRYFDANGNVIANNNTSGASNTFGSLTEISGGTGGIRYLPIAGGENRLQLNTTNELTCYLFSTFVSTSAASPGKAAVSGYQLRLASGVMKAGPEGADQLFADGFESGISIPVDLSTVLSAPLTVRAGQNYVYTITVRNNGSTALSNVQVRDFFYKRSAQPGGSNPVLEDGNWSCALSAGGSCGSGTGVIFASGISLGSGAQAVFTATRRVNDNPVPATNSQFSVAAAAFIPQSFGETLTSNNAVSQTASIVVTQPPVISNLQTTLQLFEGQTSTALPFTLTDPDTNVGSISVSASSAPPGLIEQATIGGSGENRTLTIKPFDNLSGSATVTVTANDGGNTATANVNVTVVQVNDAPVISWNPANCDFSQNGGAWTPEGGGNPGQFTYPASTQNSQNCLSFLAVNMGAPDESGQSLISAQIVSNSNPQIFAEQPQLTLKGSNTAQLRFRPNGSSGTANIGVQVTDNGGTANGGVAVSEIKIFRVKVDGAAPTISAIADQVTNEDDETSTLAFTVADGDTPVNALSVTASSSNTDLVPEGVPAQSNLPGIHLGGSGANRTVRVVPVANGFGSTTVTLTVSDGDQQGTETFIVNVTAINDAPSFSNIGDVSFASGATAGTTRQVNGWANNISVGPANEAAAGQLPDLFVVSRLDSNSPNIILSEPSVSVAAGGRLTFSLRNNGGGVAADGFACYQVSLLDTGDGTPPNVNESALAILKIQVGPGSHSCAGLRKASDSSAER